MGRPPLLPGQPGQAVPHAGADRPRIAAPRYRGRPRRRARGQGGSARDRRSVALRWIAHPRGKRATRGIQHHVVDAGRHQPATHSTGRTRVREGRAGEPPLRDGAAQPPGELARSHQRARRGPRRPARVHQRICDASRVKGSLRQAPPALDPPRVALRPVTAGTARVAFIGRGRPGAARRRGEACDIDRIVYRDKIHYEDEEATSRRGCR